MRILGRVRGTLVLAVIAASVSSCGSTTQTITKTVQAGATTPTTDLSGVSSEDEGVDTRSCDSQGINADVGNEGRCEEDGKTYVVANRASELRLRTLAVRLGDVTTTNTITSDLGETDTADGVFVVFHLTVRNRSNTPKTFSTGTSSQVAMVIGDNTYSDDFDVQNGYAVDSFLWQSKEIQPGASQSGTAVFDIPRRAAAGIDKTGNLDVINFGDSVDFDDGIKEIGVIRLWQ